MLDKKIQRHLDLLIDRYPQLLNCKEDIEKAYLILEECYENDHKLLIAGNGGSAADSEHIAGELMKRFKIQRSIPSDFAKKLKEIDQTRGADLANNLERGLMAIPLVAHEALTTAYINDVDGLGVVCSTAVWICTFGRCVFGDFNIRKQQKYNECCCCRKGPWNKSSRSYRKRRGRTCKNGRCYYSCSGNRNIHDSGTAFAGISLLVFNA